MTVLLFLLGAYLAVRLLTALHRVVDLWYAIGREWPRVVRGLVVWSGVPLALIVVLPDRHARVLVLGLAGYAACYVAAAVLWFLLVPVISRWRARNG